MAIFRILLAVFVVFAFSGMTAAPAYAKVNNKNHTKKKVKKPKKKKVTAAAKKAPAKPVKEAKPAPKQTERQPAKPAAPAPSPMAISEDSEDKKAPLKVTSERMVSDSKSNTINFYGSVIAEKGKLKVEASEMRVLSDEAQKDLKELEALGSVKITHKDKVATGDKAVYNPEARTLVLTGNTILTQGQNVARGEKVIYYFNREDMEIFSGNNAPATIILYQDDKDQPSAKPGQKK